MTEREHRAEALLREVWRELPETWDEDTDGCRYQCGGNRRRGLTGFTPHAPSCLYRRVGEFLETPQS